MKRVKNVREFRAFHSPPARHRDEALPQRVFEVIEGYVCGIVSILVAFEIIVGCLIVVIDLPSSHMHVPRIYSVPVLAFALVADGWFLGAMWDCIRNWRLPIGPSVANRFPRVPIILRPLAALWWLAHTATIFWG